jgi:uncharacterized protein
MNLFKEKSWSPYFVGILIGLLTWFAFLSADHLLGITTAIEYTSGLVLKPFAQKLSYFTDNTPKITWEWMLVLGVFLGAYFSSKLSHDRPHDPVPKLWRKRFGNNVSKRYLMAFMGGAIMMYGARVAQGCTSGHGISGILQFAVSSWIFVPVFGVVGIMTAKLIYRNVQE